MPSIVREKVDQAVSILRELEIDAWLTFARETTETGDPVLPLILGAPVTWQSAFILTRQGGRFAIVGRYEEDAVRAASGDAWTTIVPYVHGIRAPLARVLEEIKPGRIAVNYSVDDVKADGLTHGMMLLLREHLAGTGYIDSLVSAEQIIRALRGRKSAAEIERIRRAARIAAAIIEETAAYAAARLRAGDAPTERQVSDFMHARMRDGGVAPAWDSAMCPIVTTGPDSVVGHGLPSDTLRVRRGNVFHIDFGVRLDGYCSDLQRAWYVPAARENAPPAQVTLAFDAVVRAIDSAAAALRPGAAGSSVDDAARRVIVGAGYPEYQHATGHQVGRAAHDGGCVLGPQWERYGKAPTWAVEEGNVFTLELGVDDAGGRGYLGLEEMALVTPDGHEWLIPRQTSLPLLSV
jgi:Xaa-Pro aminopeptidase